MSDGERTILYMASRVLSSDTKIVVIDEPELHLHSRLAVSFWNEMERIMDSCRFIYVTHDLTFALSRADPIVLALSHSEPPKEVKPSDFPAFAAQEILGAATLPFHAKRIFVFEGENGSSFASRFFDAWFTSGDTFAIPAGNRDAVIATSVGLRSAGLVGAEIVGLVDRDFYSDEALDSVPGEVAVLDLNEIESILCDAGVVRALARHLGKDSEEILQRFFDRIAEVFVGQDLSFVVAQRVRFRVNDLLRGVFSKGQIAHDLDETKKKHQGALSMAHFEERVGKFFDEEKTRVVDGIGGRGAEMLRLLPGKRVFSILPSILGVSSQGDLISIVVESLRAEASVDKEKEAIKILGKALEERFRVYLPPRRTS